MKKQARGLIAGASDCNTLVRFLESNLAQRLSLDFWSSTSKWLASVKTWEGKGSKVGNPACDGVGHVMLYSVTGTILGCLSYNGLTFMI